MNRRSFLALALALPALGTQPPLYGHFRAREAEGFLILDLDLENRSGSPLDVLLWVGGRPAVEVSGALPPEVSQEPFTNRAGPRHVWRPLAPGEQIFAGSFRFSSGTARVFTARVRTGQGLVEVCSR